MALKKSELYSSLWASCDELRGGMDASQYKDYVLVLLFVKYVSDRFAGQPFAAITVPAGASFADMVALKGKTDIGDQINKKILGPLAQANKLSDMADFNDPNKFGSGKEMVERLTNLVAIFENPALDFSKNRADGDDLLGDAYEYLMRHFATESGKSKGQFYTPAEVSRVIAHTLGIRHAKTSNDTTVYDPTCGSGSLLLKIGDEARHGRDVKVTLYGQEKDNATAGLARMNMILHDYATAEIKQGNTLASPLYTDGDALKTFDYVVANPPFSQLRIPIAEVKPAIFGHAEFTAFNDSVTKLFAQWKKASTPLLKKFSQGGHPKALIETIAEDLLTTFKHAPLLDAYDVYQHIMDYWAETMQDDCYIIAGDGWREAAQPRLIVEDKNKKTKARPDFVLSKKKYQAELIPPALIIRRWFASEQAAIEKLEADLVALQQQMEEMAEEHGGEEGLLADAANDKGKLTRAGVTARLKEIKGDADTADERKALSDYLALVEQEAAAADKLSDAQEKLTEQVAARYPKLTEDEIKSLVVDDKWLGTIAAAVQGELDRVSQTLTGRIRQLAERYATPLPELTSEVEALAKRVDGHLKRMGFKP